MTKESDHSQDYDRKHGHDHKVKDKAALTEAFIDNKRKDVDAKDEKQVLRTPDDRK